MLQTFPKLIKRRHKEVSATSPHSCSRTKMDPQASWDIGGRDIHAVKPLFTLSKEKGQISKKNENVIFQECFQFFGTVSLHGCSFSRHIHMPNSNRGIVTRSLTQNTNFENFSASLSLNYFSHVFLQC